MVASFRDRVLGSFRFVTVMPGRDEPAGRTTASGPAHATCASITLYLLAK
jgi:hypothetical protein